MMLESQYVVAPYEADPQLAYLEKRGLVDGIITEDSDLLVFGCRTVLFKLDGEGNCVSISRDDFSQCKEYNFSEWGDKEFRQMAILSGCDYLDSIVGLGLKTAYRLMRKYKTAEKVKLSIFASFRRRIQTDRVALSIRSFNSFDSMDNSPFLATISTSSNVPNILSSINESLILSLVNWFISLLSLLERLLSICLSSERTPSPLSSFRVTTADFVVVQ